MNTPTRMSSIAEMTGGQAGRSTDRKTAPSNFFREQAQQMAAEAAAKQETAAPAASRTRRTPPKPVDGRASRIMLSTLKAFAPLIAAVTYHPGPGTSGSDAGDAVGEMMGSVDRIAREVEKVIGVNREDPGQAWITGRLSSMIASHVGRQWRVATDAQHEIDEKGIACAMSRLLAGPLPKIEDESYEKVPDNAAIYLAMMHGMGPVMVEAGLLKQFMEEARLVERVGFVEDAVVDRAAHDLYDVAAAMVNFMNPNGEQADRVIMLQSCLQQTGKLYAATLAQATDALIERLLAAEDAKQLPAALERVTATTAVDLDAVRNAFEASAMRLAVIASKFGDMPAQKKAKPA